MIGIFCIITVKSAVDSLKLNIESSLNEMGNDVVYVEKQPWNEDPGTSWWKYIKNPTPDESDLNAIKSKVKSADKASLAVFLPSGTIKYKSSNVQNAYILGGTHDFGYMFNFKFDKGRYFTNLESFNGHDRVILGNVIAEELFGNIEPLGKSIKVRGRSYTVIGVMEKEGSSLINPLDFDEALIMPYEAIKKFVNVKTGKTYGSLLNAKAATNVTNEALTDEVIGVLRSHRKLKPKEKNNFYINEVSMFSKMMEPVFTVLNSVGFVIGMFAILVGIFSVANILFVSVKERTNIIGIKKAMGARKSVILIEFLIESVLLCLIGGLFGLVAVFSVLKIITVVFDYEMYLSSTNIIIAIILAVVIGILSGIIPASQAARLDPVEAIRSK